MDYVITRDADGALKLHLVSEKFPKRSDFGDYWIGDYIHLDPNLFPDIRWGQEPTKVNVNIELFRTEVSEEQSQEVLEVRESMDSEFDSESN